MVHRSADDASRRPSDSDVVESSDRELADFVVKALDGLSVAEHVQARILMPASDRLAIRLVPLDAVDRLHEAESDKSLWDNLQWMPIRALVAFVASFGFSNKPPTGAALAIALLVRSGGSIALRPARARARRDRPRKWGRFLRHTAPRRHGGLIGPNVRRTTSPTEP